MSSEPGFPDEFLCFLALRWPRIRKIFHNKYTINRSKTELITTHIIQLFSLWQTDKFVIRHERGRTVAL